VSLAALVLAWLVFKWLSRGRSAGIDEFAVGTLK